MSARAFVSWTAPVPPMTHELSVYWEQPDPNDMQFDDTHVCMNQRDFAALREYSSSYPSGVYAGKMWKSLVRNYDIDGHIGHGGTWYLCWYGDIRADRAPIQVRQILVVD